MKIAPLTYADLGLLKEIQPPEWPDILPNLRFYVKSSFCRPVKVCEKDNIIGIGATINYGRTAWLANIIVHPAHRNRGIGTFITKHLIDSLQNGKCNTILLIATKLGEAVYRKLGFETDREYLALKRDEVVPIPIHDDKYILPFEERHKKDIFELDKNISGEDRQELLGPHLRHGKFYLERGKVTGLYLPTLGEGLVIASSSEAGEGLMRHRYAFSQKAIFPVANTVAVAFVQQYGFTPRITVPRMWLGERINWQPAGLYSRIGGNLG